MSLPYSSSSPAESPRKREELARIGPAIRLALEQDLRPRRLLTRRAFENAMVVVTALGGSTNAVLHLLNMARTAGVELHIEDFKRVNDRVPVLADLKPSGRYVMCDLDQVGGVPGVMKYLLDKGYLDGDCLTVTGATLGENLSSARLADGQDVVHTIEAPVKATGHLRVLQGSLAPEYAIGKITGKEGMRKVRRASSTARKSRSLASEKGASEPAMSSSPATRGRKAGPACRRCSP